MEEVENNTNNQITPITEVSDDIKRILCTIKIKIKDQLKQYTVGDDLEINYDNVEEDLESIPNKYLLWAMLYSEIREQKEMIDKKIRKRKGVLYNVIQKEMGDKILRRSDINDLVEADDVLEKLEEIKIIVDKQCQKIWYVLESLKMKNDNVRSLAGFKKQELYQTKQSI